MALAKKKDTPVALKREQKTGQPAEAKTAPLRNVCIICEQEGIEGKPVKEDAILGSIRAIKNALKIATNRRLIVCETCVPKYTEKRGRFEKTLVQYVAISAIIVVGLIALPLIAGGAFNFGALIFGVAIGAFITALSFTQYMPAVEGIEQKR